LVGTLEKVSDRLASGSGSGVTQTSARPITLLIAAMGGEGGGVFTDWIVKAAEHAGLPVQSTSIPGVAQRTGATTYYVEIFPIPVADLAGRQPVFSLYPGGGDVDLMIATELLEAARAVRNGYVSPQRTTLIASTHRVFTIGEKSAMGDGRLDPERLYGSLEQMSKVALLKDFSAAAESSNSPINAVFFGALSSTSVLPIEKRSFIAAIEKGGKAVRANLAGFEQGIVLGGEGRGAGLSSNEVAKDEDELVLSLMENIPSEYVDLRDIVFLGIQRLMHYQGRAYSKTYLRRIESVMKLDSSSDKYITAELARQLALRMSYEDVIRVAQLKSSRGRLQKIRSEIQAPGGIPVKVTEVLKPGVEEFCSLMPKFVASPVLRFCRKRGLINRLHVGLSLTSTTISGFVVLWLLARMRALRPMGYRFHEEQELIDEWIEDVRRAFTVSLELAESVVALARLIKGYGETHRRGLQNYRKIREGKVTLAIKGLIDPNTASKAITEATEAALADPDGKALSDQLLSAPDCLSDVSTVQS
jgi:indolepyruvate ferredoxin oxidoreductase beta subunit